MSTILPILALHWLTKVSLAVLGVVVIVIIVLKIRGK